MPAASPTAPDLRGRGETILVVEDDEDLLEITSRLLRGAGYSPLGASNPSAALELAARQDFDLLLTDLVMPEMFGHALADRIGVLRPGRAVLFMSGLVDGTRHQGVLEDGAAFILKPFDPTELLEAVQAALERSPSPGARRRDP